MRNNIGHTKDKFLSTPIVLKGGVCSSHKPGREKKKAFSMEGRDLPEQ